MVYISLRSLKRIKLDREKDRVYSKIHDSDWIFFDLSWVFRDSRIREVSAIFYMPVGNEPGDVSAQISGKCREGEIL